MSLVERLVEVLNELKRRPNGYVYPVNTDNLRAYLSGLNRGFLVALNSSEPKEKWYQLVDARRDATRNRGWKVLSISADYEMREKGIPEEDIIQEMIEIEIETWNIWEKWQEEKTEPAQ